MKKQRLLLMLAALVLSGTQQVFAQFSVTYNDSQNTKPATIFISGSETDDEPLTISNVTPARNTNLSFYKVVGGTETAAAGLVAVAGAVANGQIVVADFGTYYKANKPMQLSIKSGATTIGIYNFAARIEDRAKDKVTATGDDISSLQEDKVRSYCLEKGIKFYPKINQYKKGNQVHVFVSMDGNYILSSVPTTAREDEIYYFHVVHISGEGAGLKIEYSGEYKPKNTVYGSDTETDKAAPSGTAIKLTMTNFGSIGPFTDQFTVKIKNGADILINETVKVAQVHHISLNAGLFGTFNRNPQNITPYQLPSGDSSLSADDPMSRGMITIMLTFYPKARNLLFPITDWRERLGFIVGTGISKNLAENFFGGLSYDLARGIALAGGVHYARVSYIVDQPDFNFGTDKFTGSLDNRVKKRWDANFFIGVTLDFRLLGLIFNTASGGLGG